MIFLDTPGLLEPKDLLQRAMLDQALTALGEADVVLVVLDALEPLDRSGGGGRGRRIEGAPARGGEQGGRREPRRGARAARLGRPARSGRAHFRSRRCAGPESPT
jgi:hypothetical protein